MWSGRSCLAVVLLAAATASAAAPQDDRSAQDSTAPSSAAVWRARGLEAAFNLDHDEAETALRHAIAADPTHPAAYRQLAAVTWIRILWARGSVTVDDYLGKVSGDLQRPAPPPEVAAAFRQTIKQAIGRAEARLRDRPGDAEAHFYVGSAYGLLTVYQQTIEGRIGGGLSTARRAVAEQEKALQLAPERKDAGLQLGLYRYGVSTLALPLRIVAGVFGLGGGRARGIRLIEDAARYPSEGQANAQLALVAIYNREAQFDRALDVLTALQRRYPRNRLLWLEAAATALRAGRLAEAARFNAEGLRKLSDDRRLRAKGEDALWQRQREALERMRTEGRLR